MIKAQLTQTNAAVVAHVPESKAVTDYQEVSQKPLEAPESGAEDMPADPGALAPTLMKDQGPQRASVV